MAKRTKDIRNLQISDFYCTRCGLKNLPLPRIAGKEKEPGHLKKLFCLYCQKEVNMVEIKFKGKYSLDDFWIEYEYGNFDKEGNRKEPWKKFISKIRQGVIKDEK